MKPTKKFIETKTRLHDLFKPRPKPLPGDYAVGKPNDGEKWMESMKEVGALMEEAYQNSGPTS